MTEVYGNASSIHHFGQMARQRLDESRAGRWPRYWARVPEEIVFTSGGTEADNLAIFGVAQHGHAITTAIEHPAVLAAGSTAGFGDARFRVDGRGIVDPDDIRRALRPDTKIISVMHANNETRRGPADRRDRRRSRTRPASMLHSDGVQAAGKIPVDVEAARRRSVFDQRPQDLCAEGHRRAVCPQGRRNSRR